MNNISNAIRFKAFCDERRLAIIDYLRSGEKCACHIVEYMNIGQSAISYHMKILVESGIVMSRQEGKWVYYTLDTKGLDYASMLIKEMMKQGE